MGLTLTSDEKGVMVFVTEGTNKDGKPYKSYSLGLSSKDKDGKWINGYLNVRFKSGVDVANKTKIVVKNCFPSVSTYNGKTYTNWIITDFDILTEGGATANPDTGFMQIPDGIPDAVPFD